MANNANNGKNNEFDGVIGNFFNDTKYQVSTLYRAKINKVRGKCKNTESLFDKLQDKAFINHIENKFYKTNRKKFTTESKEH